MTRKRRIGAGVVAAVFLAAMAAVLGLGSMARTESEEPIAEVPANSSAAGIEPHPMAIRSLRDGDYPGGRFAVEEILADGSGYSRSIVSYLSEGLRIRGLLTVPLSAEPDGGYPAVLFIHGYIPPDQYSTTGNYASYQARLARSGFVTFKPDLRGHGDSEGTPVSAHYSEKYVVDTLFALSYLKNHESVNPGRIGYWGHSNGGEIGLRVLVSSPDVRAASLWAGVVGSYEDMFETYNDQIRFLRNAEDSELVRLHGLPSTNREFWSAVDPYYHLDSIRAPVQLLHGTGDASVPVVLSRRLREDLAKAGKAVDYHEYDGDDHNLSANVDAAFERTIAFYREHL